MALAHERFVFLCTSHDNRKYGATLNSHSVPMCSQFMVPKNHNNKLIQKSPKFFTDNDLIFTVDEDRETWLCATGSLNVWFDLKKFGRNIEELFKWMIFLSDYSDDDLMFGRIYQKEFNMSLQFFQSLSPHQIRFLFGNVCPVKVIRIIVDYDPPLRTCKERLNVIKHFVT